MAKFIETKDGVRMIVSDEMPDLDYENNENQDRLKSSENIEEITPDFPILLLKFNEQEQPISIQCNKFAIKNDTVKISGLILLTDFIWLVEKRLKAELYSITIEHSEKIHSLVVGPHVVNNISAKDINSIVAVVNLSLKKHT